MHLYSPALWHLKLTQLLHLNKQIHATHVQIFALPSCNLIRAFDPPAKQRSEPGVSPCSSLLLCNPCTFPLWTLLAERVSAFYCVDKKVGSQWSLRLWGTFVAPADGARESQDGATWCASDARRSTHVWTNARVHTQTQTQTHTHTRALSPPGRSWLRSVCSSIAMGIPTFFERPATNTFFPTVSIPAHRHYSQRLQVNGWLSF